MLIKIKISWINKFFRKIKKPVRFLGFTITNLCWCGGFNPTIERVKGIAIVIEAPNTTWIIKFPFSTIWGASYFPYDPNDPAASIYYESFIID